MKISKCIWLGGTGGAALRRCLVTRCSSMRSLRRLNLVSYFLTSSRVARSINLSRSCRSSSSFRISRPTFLSSRAFARRSMTLFNASMRVPNMVGVVEPTNNFVHERVRFAPVHERARVTVQTEPGSPNFVHRRRETVSDNPRLSASQHCRKRLLRLSSPPTRQRRRFKERGRHARILFTFLQCGQDSRAP